ncbi:MAG: lamin tail domain-containing protein [Candidatus Delongbacteria bacterium]|nr:lamin tail domain-containing protein [Candidatus Delongbacteria bacterium]
MHCSAKYFSLALVLSSVGLAGAQGVFFSEYIEGSSNNKAFEVYNGTGAPIDLEDYVIERLNGGSTTPTLRAFTGMLADGDVFVIANASADPAILAVADVTSDLTFYNGDDFLGLYEVSGTDTTLIDGIGERGVDPGTNWPVGTGATSEYTLVRMAGVTQGNTVWAGAGDTEWDVYPQNTFSYLGYHGLALPIISNIVLNPANPSPLDAVSVSADLSDNGSIVSAELAWGLTSGSLTNTIAMSLSAGSTWTTDSAIPAQLVNTDVFYTISATDDEANVSTTPEQSYTVLPLASLNPGDLVVSEILQNPNVVSDAVGEWFEVYNATDNAIDLLGLTFNDNGVNTFTVDVSVVVAPHDYAVLGLNGDTMLNGGVTLDYVYPGSYNLGNGADAIIILEGATEIDRVEYDGGTAWPDPTGASMYLLDLNSDNNVGANWSTSTTPFGAGDLGTPGGAAPSAPSILSVDRDILAPIDTDVVTVTADVVDDGTLVSVDLIYTIDGGADNVVAMSLPARAIYTGVIPAQADGSIVAYRVEATDDNAETTVSDVFGYTVEALGCADITVDLRTQDANEVPVNLNAVVQVCGIVTVGHEFGAAGPACVENSTGAMAIYGPTGSPFIGDATAIGDEVEVIGVLTQYNGLSEVNVTSINVISSGNPVTPTVILGDGMNEATEAMLVTMENVVFDTPGVQPITGSGLNFTAMVDGTFPILVRVDVDVVGVGNSFTFPAGPTSVTGIVGQFDTSAPYDGGYQLQVRNQGDVPIGAGNLPPAIAGLSNDPGYPDDTDIVLVTATITDSDGTVSGATLHYSLNAGADNTAVMSASGDVYSALIPVQSAGTVVAYYVTATDDMSDTSTSQTISYTVTAPLSCLPISDVAADDANGVALLVGSTVKVCGTVTAGTIFDASGPVYIEDGTGGAAIFSGDVVGMNLQPGDQIEATGVVSNYNGLTEISSNPMVVVTGSGPAPVGTLVPAASITTPAIVESLESTLVRIENVVFPTSGQVTIAGSGQNYTCTADGEVFTVRIDRDIAYEIAAVPDQFILPAGPVTLTAIVSQFDSSAPHDSGYQLLVRFQSDIAEALPAPALSVVRVAGDIQLSWDMVSGATSYNVYRSSTPYGGFTLLGNTASTSYTDSGAVVLGKRFYLVTAAN